MTEEDEIALVAQTLVELAAAPIPPAFVHKKRKLHHKHERFDNDVRDILMCWFNKTNYLTRMQYIHLGLITGLSQKQLQDWFANARSRGYK